MVVTDELVPIHLFFFCSHHLTMMTWAVGAYQRCLTQCVCLIISSVVMYCATLLVLLMLDNFELLSSDGPNDVQGFRFRNE